MKWTGSIAYHFDVWGHEPGGPDCECGADGKPDADKCDGWQVNDSRHTAPIVVYTHADESPSEEQIKAALSEDFDLSGGAFGTHGDEDSFYRADGKPILSIDWEWERERLKFSVEFEVDETWIADGFDLDDDRAMDMLRKTLGWAREDELGARVISAPDPELIKWFQGGRKVRP